MSWDDVDAWREEHQRNNREVRDALRLAKMQDKAKQWREQPTVYHLSGKWPPYHVRMKTGGTRTYRGSEVYRLGAASRKRLVLNALCGKHNARAPGETHHRVTMSRKQLTCEACLVLLDRGLEQGVCSIERGKVKTPLDWRPALPTAATAP